MYQPGVKYLALRPGDLEIDSNGRYVLMRSVSRHPMYNNEGLRRPNHHEATAADLGPEGSCQLRRKRVLFRGHQCSNVCSNACGECRNLTFKMLPCGHDITLPCNHHAEDATCLQQCERILPCGHPCQLICGAACDEMDCVVEVLRKTSCGHIDSVPCNIARQYDRLLSNSCNQPCRKMLTCGHLCSGNCTICKRGREHIRCREKCPSICNHNCRCNHQQCENRCVHSSCPNRCELSGLSYMEPSAWRCQPHYCIKLSREPWIHPPRDDSCKYSLGQNY